MSIQVPPVGSQDTAEVSAVQSIPRVETATRPARHQPRPVEAVVVDTMPSRPPADVLTETEKAGARYDELRSHKRELHFRHDEHANRVVVEVRDLEGNVLRTVPPSKALEIISGEPCE
jgi:flagellar protein FlaG